MNGYSIKGYRSIRGHGDSPTFEATLCKDGKPVLRATNDGWGGPNLYELPVSRVDDPRAHGIAYRAAQATAHKDALAWLAAHSGWWDEYVEAGTAHEGLDWFVEELINATEATKKAKRILGGKMIGVTTDGRMMEWKRLPKKDPRRAEQDRAIRAAMPEAFPGIVILNDMTIEEASSHLYGE